MFAAFYIPKTIWLILFTIFSLALQTDARFILQNYLFALSTAHPDKFFFIHHPQLA